MYHSTLFAVLAAFLPLSQAQGQAPISHPTTVVVIDYFPAVAPSTVYQTSIITVLGCPAWETNCPVRNGQTRAVVTATVGATTTVCPLTLSQARLSTFDTTVPPSAITGGPLSTTSTTWPTAWTLPSSYPLPSSYSIDPAVWASIFPSGAPALTDSATYGSFDPGQFTGYPSGSATALDLAEGSALGLYAVSTTVHSGTITLSSFPQATSETTTTGSFAAILSSNTTSYITTINAFTSTFNGSGSGSPNVVGNGGAAPNGTRPGFPTLTTASNGTFVTGAPIPQQTVNDGPALPVNLFSLLVAISAIAFAL